jgi:sugar lactone lactonase YvrE
MNASQRLPSGALYRFQSDVGFISVRNKVVVPNGLSWDPSGRFMFFTDSWVGDVLRFPYGSEGGLGQPEVFFATGAAPGQPDGATFDVDGCMWSARFGAGQVVRIMPNGTIDTIVHVPTDQVTSCTFGGVSRELLFITTATALLGEEAQAAQPLAGSLFIANVGTQGLPDARLDT